jgi:hypothetical protein
VDDFARAFPAVGEACVLGIVFVCPDALGIGEEQVEAVVGGGGEYLGSFRRIGDFQSSCGFLKLDVVVAVGYAIEVYALFFDA